MTVTPEIPPEAGREFAPGMWEYPPVVPRQYRRIHPSPTAAARVEAVQLTADNGGNVWEWANCKPFVQDGQCLGLTVFTPAGRARATQGSWVVRIGHEWWVVEDAEFTATYEQVGESES
ncbi:MAG TPA: hypothetical protein VFP72_14500 [Kineosporiaceae bacterium]|nr:hypothetical protein [Kineosporiaceae bacterium]